MMDAKAVIEQLAGDLVETLDNATNVVLRDVRDELAVLLLDDASPQELAANIISGVQLLAGMAS